MRTNLFFLATVTIVGLSLHAATVRPSDDGRALVNPGMGWTMHFYSNIPWNYGALLEPGDDCAWFPGCSTCYLRLPWAMIEPEEGKFNWAALDSPAQRWIARGGQIALRITSSESWFEYATPKWVEQAGAKGVRWNFGEWGKPRGLDPQGALWDPDFGDPVFLEKLENFVRKLAERYDGRPEVAFVDIGSYGLWGEGHTLMSQRVPPEKARADVRKHIDIYRKHFKRTPLVISDDVDGHDNQSGLYPILDYARSKGVGWRDDSILVQPPPRNWYHADQAERYWRTLPVVLEHEHYDPSVKRSAWKPELLVKSVEEMHASYMSIHGDAKKLLDENREVVDRINRRLGYRFQLHEVTWPDEIAVGPNAKERPFSVRWTWANAGVAPSYRNFYPCLTVKDGKGRIMAVMADDGFDLAKLPVAEPGKAVGKEHEMSCWLGRWAAPKFAHGTFDVYVSVGEADGTPVVELPLPSDDGQRRYKIGRITFREGF